jgi:hypothetical protein
VKLPLLTNSRLKTARACLRLDKYKYRLGYKPAREPTETRFGTLMHDGLEAWFNGWQLPPEDRLAAALAAVLGEAADPFEQVRAEELMAGYHYRWIDESARYEVLGVEVEFEGPLVNPANQAVSRTWARGGKVDALVREYDTNRKLFLEHKTSSEDIRQGSDYWVRLRMDSQVSTYYEGGRLLGHKIEGCIYDVIAKPKIRPSQVPELDDDGVKIVLDADGGRVRTKNGKAWRQTADTALNYVLKTRTETPDEYRKRLIESIAAEPEAYFQRGDVVRLEEEIHEALLDDWHFARFLRDSVREDIAPRNPDACKRYGRTCEFFGVCTGTASLEDERLFVRLENVNPELTGQEEVAA